MIRGLSANALYDDSIPCHDFRDSDKWQKKPENGWDTDSSNIVSITLSSGQPVTVEFEDDGFKTGMQITFNYVGGAIELNGNTYKVTLVDDNTVTLDGTNGDNFSEFTSGGYGEWEVLDSGCVISPGNGLALVVSSVWLKMSCNANMHSPLLIIYKDKNGNVIRQTTYATLDDFLDRFTKFEKMSVDRYDNTIEFYEYVFPQPLVLRSANTPQGAMIPYFHSIEVKIQDDIPYVDDNGEQIEYCRVRYPDVQVHLDEEYTG